MLMLIPGYQRLVEEERARQSAMHRIDHLPLAPGIAAGAVHVIDTAAAADNWAERLHGETVSMIGVDTEFTFDRPPVILPNGREFVDIYTIRPQVCTIAVWCGAGDQTSTTNGALIRLLFDLRRPEVYPGLRALFKLHVPWIAHAGTAELHCLRACGVEPAGHLLIDTCITAAALNLGRFHRRNRTDGQGGEAAAAREAEVKSAHIISLIGQCDHFGLKYPFGGEAKDRLRRQFLDLGLDDPLDEEMIEYASADAEYALRLHLAQQADVQRQGLLPHLARVEWPMVEAVACMERTGLPVNLERLAEYQELCRDLAASYAAELEQYGIPAGSRNSFLMAMHRAGQLKFFIVDGKYSTAMDVLRAAEKANIHPAVRPFRLHRYFARLAGDPFLAGTLVSADGRQRCTLAQLRSASGRVASSRPNLVGLDKRLRPVVEAPPGMVLIELDYSQKEVGVAGAEWQEPRLVEQFHSGDSYAAMAQAFYACQLSDAERAMNTAEFAKARKDLRRKVKSLVLGIMYGRGAKGIAESFGCSITHAQAELDRFFDMYPNARDSAKATVQRSLLRGYGLSATGLRRFVERGNRRLANALRNHPIQSSACAIFKMAVVLIHNQYRGTPTQLLLPRHDSVLLLTPIGTEREVIATCEVLMKQAVRAVYADLRPRVDAKVEGTWPTEQTLEEYHAAELGEAACASR